MITQRILTSPVRLTGSVHPQQLCSLVAVDAMARRRAALGLTPPIWEVSTLSGDAAVQRAVRRAVAREGDAPEELGREGFAERARRLEAEADADLRSLLAGLRIGADLDRWPGNSEAASRVARVAFVRLYDAGLLRLSDAVLDSCSNCQTVVDEADSDQADLHVQRLRLQVPLIDGTMTIDLNEPEMLVGAVALAVPADTAPADTTVQLPLVDHEVPIIAVVDLDEPRLVVPGHDSWSYDLARRFGYRIVQVLDAEGVVRQPGPLEGLGRYAARAAATEQLAAEGYVVAHFDAVESVRRCHRCGTVLVPLVGRHWLLSMADIAMPVIEAIEAGQLAFSPVSAAQRLLDAIHNSGVWSVSQQLWAGHPIPVSTCLDCGATQVSVDQEQSCGSCMGTLSPSTDVLDARFIAACTPLAMMGWPDKLEDPESVNTTLSIGLAGLDIWALPMAALGLRLAGIIPFSQVVVAQLAVGAEETGTRNTNDLIAMVETETPEVLRAALLTGDFDFERARDAVDVLRNPLSGDADLAGYVEAYDKALGALDAGGALGMLVNAARTGIRDDARPKLAELVAPLLSDTEA